MVQIRDLKSKTTIWDVSFEDILDGEGNIVERVVHGLELDKGLASIDRTLSESQLRYVITSTIKEAINKVYSKAISDSESEKKVYGCLSRDFGPSKGKIGEFKYINGDLGSHTCEWLHKFGRYNDVRMYISLKHTYCLMRREDNGTFFFTEIVPAPEIGEDETKFQAKRPHEVPPILLKDARFLLQKAKSRHT